jgi:hypothetical protein
VSILISRSHLVTFRLTAEEYENLKVACATERARSIAEFARSSVLQKVEAHQNHKVSLVEDLATLTAHLGELDGVLVDIRERISRVLGRKKADG